MIDLSISNEVSGVKDAAVILIISSRDKDFNYYWSELSTTRVTLYNSGKIHRFAFYFVPMNESIYSIDRIAQSPNDFHNDFNCTRVYRSEMKKLLTVID